LFIQHDHVSPVGLVGERFEERGFEVRTMLVVPEERFHAPDVSVEFGDPAAYDAIVPMGAPWSVTEAGRLGWIADELSFLHSAHHTGVPLLGICFGGQALAAALGGSVERAPRGELGWVSVETADRGVIEAGPWFQWHDDRWVPPAGARELARTQAAPQAFLLRRTLGLQFHPEITTSMLELWLANGGTEYVRERGVDPDVLVSETRATECAAADRTKRLVDRFLDLIARFGAG
jgi:GMP synthase-like glutamine amidotransferase